MSVYNSRIDAYIEKSAPFAQPILNHVRGLIHKECLDIEETIKWGFPHFEYKGRTQFSMAAFKQHCAFGFWLAPLINDEQGILQKEEKASMGSLGRIISLKDLPSDKILSRYFKESLKLTDEGVKVPKKVAQQTVSTIEAPADFMNALKKNKKALAVFEQFAPSHKKEYLEWITQAKREVTRNKRITEAIEWMAEGKSRHWKYKR